jgi:hypothetical protein
MTTLFLNNKIINCEVYQYGLRLYNILKKTNTITYVYVELDNYDNYLNAIQNHNPENIIYNFHISTMNWLNTNNIQKNKLIKNIGIIHKCQTTMFDIILNINSEIEDNLNDHIYSIPRPIYENVDKMLENYTPSSSEIIDFINYKDRDTPIFGSFGFATGGKGFDKIVKYINDNYSRAIIKLVIPMAHFHPTAISDTSAIKDECYLANYNKNIKLLITHEFFSNEDLLYFLKQTTMNIFLYEKQIDRGQSSEIDYAISVETPFAISDSYMFNHIYDDNICLYKNNIIDIYNYSIQYSNKLKEKYSHKNMIRKFYNILKPQCMLKMNVSVGESIDKYNILELKKKYILDSETLIEIQKEMDELNECKQFIHKYPYFYKLLNYINDLIWQDNNIISSKKDIDLTTHYEITNRIFINNQKRFRIKKYFNQLFNSNLKEQKGYNKDIIHIIIECEEDIYSKIPELNYEYLMHDVIYIDVKYKNTINKLFINPNICFTDECDDAIPQISISSLTIIQEEKEIYSFNPITYISGGLLGDFIHQLSVINEQFYETGQQGILYITNNVGDNFRYGIENTYNDTYEVISSQKYIKEYKILSLDENVDYDVNLSSWRELPIIKTWYDIFKSSYKVEWGINKWLHISYDKKWENIILVNITSYRFVENIDGLKELYKKYGNKMVFISSVKSDYIYFINKMDIQIPLYEPKSFTDLCVAINSCYYLIGGLSAPLAIGCACHKTRTVALNSNNENKYYSMNSIWKNITYL